MKNMNLNTLDDLRMWLTRYQDFLVAWLQSLQQANAPADVQQ
jgi:hypothetical protein